jgi:hypothetical protein
VVLFFPKKRRLCHSFGNSTNLKVEICANSCNLWLFFKCAFALFLYPLLLKKPYTVKDTSEKPVKAEILLKQRPKERPPEAPFGVMFYGLMPADLK